MKIRYLGMILIMFVLLSMSASSWAQEAPIYYIEPTPADAVGNRSSTLRRVGLNGTNPVVPLPNGLTPVFPVFSPNGRFIAFTSPNPSLPPIHLSQSVFEFDRMTGQTRELLRYHDFFDPIFNTRTSSTRPVYKAYSPDGQWMALCVITSSGIRSVIGLEVRSLASPNLIVHFSNHDATIDGIHFAGLGVDWAPDGSQIAYPKRILQGPNVGLQLTAIVMIDPNTGQVIRQLTSPVDSQTPLPGFGFQTRSEHDYAPVFSPNGQGVAYIRIAQTQEINASASPPVRFEGSIRITGVDGTNDRAIFNFPPDRVANWVHWSPDGTQLVFDLGPRSQNPLGPLQRPNPDQTQVFIINSDGSGLTPIAPVPSITPNWAPFSN